MALSIDEATARSLLALVPWAGGSEEERLKLALQSLTDAERWRRGEPDATGALHKLALTQGELLQQEYDLGTHGHLSAWEIGVMGVDVVELIRVNQRLGFEAGDAVLKATAAALKQAHPRARVVRIHSDAFAVLFPPSAGETVEEPLRARTRERLVKATEPLLEGGPALEFTVSLLRLEIAQPSHWQVLGPLVWAEAERAHVLERRGGAAGVQRRRIELGAAIPLMR